ncbi:unnamed protein product [Clavelina lepadiformis]|uniref:Cytochrome P450 n=1 Tax=Clavelina lepadiformis TaxID=159417 RepID=A0ABP0FGH1_CLALP
MDHNLLDEVEQTTCDQYVLFSVLNTCNPSSTQYEQLIQYMRELYTAGGQTTSGMLSWGLLSVVHYPQTQKKFREEINEVIGDGKVNTSSKASMPYTNAFIQELMRIRTMVIFTIPHETTEDMDLKEFKIPKGTAFGAKVTVPRSSVKYISQPLELTRRHLIVGYKLVLDSDNDIGTRSNATSNQRD